MKKIIIFIVVIIVVLFLIAIAAHHNYVKNYASISGSSGFSTPSNFSGAGLIKLGTNSGSATSGSGSSSVNSSNYGMSGGSVDTSSFM